MFDACSIYPHQAWTNANNKMTAKVYIFCTKHHAPKKENTTALSNNVHENRKNVTSNITALNPVTENFHSWSSPLLLHTVTVGSLVPLRCARDCDDPSGGRRTAQIPRLGTPPFLSALCVGRWRGTVVERRSL